MFEPFACKQWRVGILFVERSVLARFPNPVRKQPLVQSRTITDGDVCSFDDRVARLAG